LDQTGGDFDVFIAGMGPPGGTSAGAAYFKSERADVQMRAWSRGLALLTIS